MFLEILQQSPGHIRGAILVAINVRQNRKVETRYCSRFGVFYYTSSGMSGIISVSGYEYQISSDKEGFFSLTFPEYPDYWSKLHEKQTEQRIETWALSRRTILLRVGR